MKKMFCAAVMAVTCVAGHAAHADDVYAVTPSGATEEMFAGNPEDTIGKLSSRCIDAHWTVISSTPSELVCEAPMNMGQSILGQMLMGNSYSTPPRRFFRFNAATINGVSRVQVSGWMELQMALGQTKRTDFSGAAFHNNMMSFLSSAGGQFPVGTTFPHHAFLGASFADAPMGKTVGLRVEKFQEGSAAAKAGVQVGDIVTSIAGKKFKNVGDLLDASAKATKTPTYPVEVLRDGKAITFQVQTLYRAAWAEALTPSPASQTQAVAAAQAPQRPLSVADELAKMAKLKADGVITEAEFEAEKAKLLAQ